MICKCGNSLADLAEMIWESQFILYGVAKFNIDCEECERVYNVTVKNVPEFRMVESEGG